MREADSDIIKTLSIRINGAGALLDAIHMGLVPLTPEIIGSTAWELRNAADKLEAMQGRYAAPSESEGGHHD